MYIYIYHYSDYDYVNEIINNPLVKGTYKYTTILIDPALNYLPSAETIQTEFGRMWYDFGTKIASAVSDQLILLKGMLFDKARLILCMLLTALFKEVWLISSAIGEACDYTENDL